METFNEPSSARRLAAEQLQVINEANDDLWFPHPSDSPIRRHPFIVAGYVLVACAVVAFNMTYGLDDGWVGWLAQFLFLAQCGGPLALHRWFLRDRGLNLTWFPPGRVYKKQAKLSWPVMVLIFLTIPVTVYWMLGKPFWINFAVLLGLTAALLCFGDYWYRKSYPTSEQ